MFWANIPEKFSPHPLYVRVFSVGILFSSDITALRAYVGYTGRFVVDRVVAGGLLGVDFIPMSKAQVILV